MMKKFIKLSHLVDPGIGKGAVQHNTNFNSQIVSENSQGGDASRIVEFSDCFDQSINVPTSGIAHFRDAHVKGVPFQLIDRISAFLKHLNSGNCPA